MKIKIVFIFLTLLALHRFCHWQTGGFSISKICSSFEALKEPFSLSTESKKALCQPYGFMGSGAQTFVFLSKDGRYVLKFFRHHRARHLLRPFMLLLPSSTKKRIISTEKKRSIRLKKDFQSYTLAASLLPKETGILSLHLDKTSGFLPLVLYDKIGVRHFMNLEDFEFVLQKRALPFYSTLEMWIQEGNLEKARNGLSTLLALLHKRIALGLGDKDPDLCTNFGFIGETVVQFDPGRFRSSEERLDELKHIMHPLCVWLDEKAPVLADELRQSL